MSTFMIALIRTAVPLLVGSAVGWLASIGLALDPSVEAEAVLGITVLAGSLYYAGISWLAVHVPVFGWLLGVANTPIYSLEAAEAKYLPKHAA
ncbi:hypothetical protein [Cryobacterium sp. SO1]|uniref:hypothetical protein n=1 Tax=Cryobacterium sp. SO1 TaxID=1897061 RepID=UPI0010231657|nr:hypothetical protein [Cryobacterium sp. SO1]RZI35307.1 hypothetical protein BJQ95_02374 [Cryobacterium sp. SO1]